MRAATAQSMGHMGAASTLALLLLLSKAAADEVVNFVSVYAGRHFQQPWSRAFVNPGSLDFYGESVVGIAGGREWPLIWSNVTGGVEAQANLHFGLQSYAELGLPLFIRYTPAWSGPLRSFGAGLGLSVTSEVSEVEIDKGGASQKLLFYWFLETEFGTREAQVNPFLRLHHRSNGFETFEEPGSSNALVVGLRRRF